ncbi:hypothetical protein [Aquirufa aurantiipilula]|uniref:Nuclear transport factor 2 family protein n=1 Tax=Aquirufa aurantiipilula TaxID=2696561 RepID=A0ABT6BLJ1_9BACT|nr:hypothetical protein [Aquirufa aurantiipilula]MDF5691327.1 hypothetical protein [Aquirufa aurantiipilula]
MNKIIYLLLASSILLACAKKEEANSPKMPNQNGYTVITSENIDMVKKFNDLAIAFDTAAMRAMYSSPQDTINDNLMKLTVGQSLQNLAQLNAAHIKPTIKKYGALWETINDEPNPKGVKNIVIAYIIMNLNNGKESKDVLLQQVCAIKDGKIVEEWDVYDTKPFEELMKAK